ncbi:hypothetical protein CHS0354_005335 [Potamilus streckersoni]|uniref:Uncharacterized protein n=1 Tax=Potamilus streckersoni TaxID=2493646 RepID=A0AAE0SG40_9BIVA|nr:hypothetical protein CHS0354_005335 [Potamilus streckersoni]
MVYMQGSHAARNSGILSNNGLYAGFPCCQEFRKGVDFLKIGFKLSCICLTTTRQRILRLGLSGSEGGSFN